MALKKTIILIIVPLLSSSCTKEGKEGKATITGHVIHHQNHISNAIVFIKYGATELPGTNVTDFDDRTTASSGDGHYEFEELNKGNYYLYSTGYDSAIFENVAGGIPVEIKKKLEIVEIDVPVKE